jgi:hypothetical protein
MFTWWLIHTGAPCGMSCYKQPSLIFLKGGAMKFRKLIALLVLTLLVLSRIALGQEARFLSPTPGRGNFYGPGYRSGYEPYKPHLRNQNYRIGYGTGGYGDPPSVNFPQKVCTTRSVDQSNCTPDYPGQGQYEWRFIRSLGWRKMSLFGAAEKDWWDYQIVMDAWDRQNYYQGPWWGR